MYSPETPISTPSPEEMYKKYTDPSTLHDPRVDEVLKRAAMGGDPNYPQVYAIMAMQARTASKAQLNTPQQPQGPQPTVAQEVIAKAAPHPMEQGVASLPVDHNTFHAAGGGMVSFADEGLVEGDTPYVKNDPRYETDSVPGAFLFDSQDEAAAKLKRSNTSSALAKSNKAPDASTGGQTPAISMEKYKQLAAEGLENRKKPAPETKKDTKKGAGTGIAALKPNVTQPETDIAAETAARYHTNVGEDPDAADRKARMEALGASTAEEKRKAPWLALANAGFGMMASPSQYFGQAVGAGAQQGLASLSESQKDIARAQERHAAMQDAIGERDYARRAKGAELGMTTEAASKKAAQDESQFGRELVSREKIAATTASAYAPYRQQQANTAEQRNILLQLKPLQDSLMGLKEGSKEKVAVQTQIAQLQQQFNALGSGAGGPPSALAAAPVGGTLAPTDKSGLLNYTPAS